MWHPPLSSWVKINFDTHVSLGALRGLGVLFRNNAGKILLGGVRHVNSLWSPKVCEVVAALFGMELAVQFGYRLVHLEGNCMN